MTYVLHSSLLHIPESDKAMSRQIAQFLVVKDAQAKNPDSWGERAQYC
jgi:hypothetical protein